jgi:serine/threonine protein kinase
MPLALGTRLASYEIVDRLGAGGMGEVYRARDVRLNRHVALKVITSSGDVEARRRLLQEARAAAAVSHPNICQIFEIGDGQDALFITMELLSGETLADRIVRGPLAVSQAIPLAVETLTALHVIHEHGLVHRDLKPANIFLTPHGVKILDFGLARPASLTTDPALTQTATRLTQAGTMMGTPRYMSPEQIHGRPVDARSDLFAMGATLYEMLIGKRVLHGATARAVGRDRAGTAGPCRRPASWLSVFRGSDHRPVAQPAAIHASGRRAAKTVPTARTGSGARVY